MTEQRSLKKIVRERMSRTGESYETARRHVIARRPRPVPAGVTPGYPAFGAEEHQPSAQARHLLAQAGFEVSEAMACGLGGGIGFLYSIFEYASVPHPLLTIVAQHHPQPWLEAVAQHLGISTSTARSSSVGAALTKLDATLDGGQAAGLTVGRGLLPWHKNVAVEESAAPYDIVVAGRDGGDYLVEDLESEPHRLSAAGLGEAWAVHRKGRFAIFTIDPIMSPPDLPAAVRAAMSTTVAHLTGPVLGHSFDSNFGLSGMQKLAAELRDSTTKNGWARRFGSLEAFATGMTRLDDCLTWQYTAPGGTRPLYAQFLREAGPVAGLQLGAAVAAAEAAGEQWSRVASVARQARASDPDPTATFAILADLVDEAIVHERGLVGALDGS